MLESLDVPFWRTSAEARSWTTESDVPPDSEKKLFVPVYAHSAASRLASAEVYAYNKPAMKTTCLTPVPRMVCTARPRSATARICSSTFCICRTLRVRNHESRTARGQLTRQRTPRTFRDSLRLPLPRGLCARGLVFMSAMWHSSPLCPLSLFGTVVPMSASATPPAQTACRKAGERGLATHLKIGVFGKAWRSTATGV